MIKGMHWDLHVDPFGFDNVLLTRHQETVNLLVVNKKISIKINGKLNKEIG